MKYNTIILTLAAAALFTGQAFSQSADDKTRARKDSVDFATERQLEMQNRNDENKVADAKRDSKETKAKAKEAERIEDEANDAARESKNALRDERRAQKARKKADKQAQKAAKARAKANNN